MCLDSVTRTVTTKRERRFFKVYRRDADGSLRNVYYDCYSTIKPGVMWSRSRRKIKATTGGLYKLGFHMFTRMEDAVAWADSGEVIISVHVPKGTPITYGRLETAVIAVSPTIIIKEEEFKKCLH